MGENQLILKDFVMSLPNNRYTKKNPVKTSARNLLGAIIMLLVSFSSSRRGLNSLYQRLNYSQKSGFHRWFAKIFFGHIRRVQSGDWIVDFVGRKIRIPIRSDKLALDWAIALSIQGHDIEVKQTYESFINSPNPPQHFIDIGANYGTHSLLFLIHDINTITFEPNSLCTEYFSEICSINGLKPHISCVALGNNATYVELWFPQNDTWLGSTNNDVKASLGTQENLVIKKVKQQTLDNCLNSFSTGNLLIKIDTEGSEHQILQGAANTLKLHKPRIIFESLSGEKRNELFDFFSLSGYQIANLPWTEDHPAHMLSLPEFTASPKNNFIALPNS